jgi:hypothetical protein
MKNRLCAILLCSIFIFISGCSDSSESENDDKTEETSTEAESVYDGPEIVELNGFEFITTVPNNEIYYRDVYSEEEVGEALNDTVYRRNMTIEDRYDIKLTVNITDTSTDTDVIKYVSDCVNAGEDFSSIVLGNTQEASAMTTGRYLLNFNDIESINLSNSWWDQDIANTLTVSGKTFMTVGDMLNLSVGMCHARVFNKRLLQDAGVEFPYQAVRDGDWTVDKLISSSKTITNDINGDGEIKLNEDIIGYAGIDVNCFVDMIYACGGTVTQKNSDGVPELALNSEKTVAIIDLARRLFSEKYTVVSAAQYKDYMASFSNGLAGFLDIAVNDITQFRGMDDDFGIVPPPKFDEEQDSYRCLINGYGTFITIPVTASESAENIGIVLEGLMYESSVNVLPVYYETVIQNKYARDAESVEMLEIIRNNRTTDFSYVYQLPGFTSTLWSIINDGKEFGSFYASNEKVFDSSLDKALEIYLK